MAEKKHIVMNKPRKTATAAARKRERQDASAETTRLKQAEQNLAESEEWHRALVETAGNAGQGIVVIQNTPEREAALVFVNDAACRITGYTREEVLGMSLWEFFKSPGELEIIQERYRQRQRGESVTPYYETNVVHKDGTNIPVEASLTLMSYGGKIATVSFFNDITERKKAEEELHRHRQHLEELVSERTTELERINKQLQQEIAERKQAEAALQESERYFRSIIESASEVVITLDSAGTPRYLSPSYERLLGYKPADPVGRAVFELVHPDDLPTAIAKFNELLQNPGSIQHVEVRGRHKDGSWRTLEVIGRNLLDDPVVKSIVVNYRDITERKQAEEKLRDSEKYFRSLIENVSDAIAIYDSDGILRYLSPNYQHLLGREPGDRVGGGAFDFLHPEDLQRVAGHITEFFQSPGSIRREEVRGLHKDGSWRTMEVTAKNLLDDPVVKGIVVNYHDITERKQAEEKLQQLYDKEKVLRQQLEAEIKRRVEFTRALAHELKTPLTPMLISSQMLASELKEEPLLLGLATNINKGAQNLNSRIDELLDIAKGEIGLLQLKPRTLHMQPLLKEVTEYVSPLASSSNQSLVLEIPDALPPVKADLSRIRQVVLNLLNNAFKFTPEGGKIILRATSRNDSMIVEVEDNGPGIELEYQQHLFEPYHPLGVGEEHLSSLGLGLALCKMLVHLHGGQIWVKSQPGKGSTFSFSLPLEATNRERKEGSEIEGGS